jgi:hypothetical protein
MLWQSWCPHYKPHRIAPYFCHSLVEALVGLLAVQYRCDSCDLPCFKFRGVESLLVAWLAGAGAEESHAFLVPMGLPYEPNAQRVHRLGGIPFLWGRQNVRRVIPPPRLLARWQITVPSNFRVYPQLLALRSKRPSSR